jgi:uncharacterized protein
VNPAHPRHAALRRLVEARLPPGELAHDIHHIDRVHAWALRLSPEAGADSDLAGAAALVHDLVFVPKDSAERSQGGERSAAAAPGVLAEAGYRPDEIAAVAEAVRTSSWSRGLAPSGPLGRVLQDADRLDAIGALGLMRNLACAQHMAKPGRGGFYEPADPLARSGRPLDDKAWATDHCFAKLLKLAAGMHTPTARAEAARRHAFIEAWLAEVGRELEPQP